MEQKIVYIGNDDAVKLILQASMSMEQKVGDMMASIDDLREGNAELTAAVAALQADVAEAAARVDAKIQAFIDAQVQDSDVNDLRANVAALVALGDAVAMIGEDAPEEPPVEEPPVEPPVEEPPVEEPPVEPPVEEPPVEPPPAEEPSLGEP